MAFNHRINISTVVSSMHPNLRRQVLFSLVGTANAIIVSAADNHVRRLMDDGINDFKTLDVREVEHMLAGIDFTTHEETLLEMRRLYALRTEWAAQLEADTGTDKNGSISGTLDMLTGKQRARPLVNGAEALLKAVGVEITPEQIKAAAAERQARDQFFADQRAERRGAVEWFIENLLARVEPGADAEDSAYLDLSTETKERLAQKLVTALSKALTTATQNVLTGRSGAQDLGLADIPIIRDLSTRLNAALWPIEGLETGVTPARVAELQSKFRRAPAPTNATGFDDMEDDLEEPEC